jgi:hypothetical protein
MPNIYDRRMFKLAQGGMIPPEEDAIDSMEIITPEQESQIYQEAEGLPSEVFQAANSGLEEVSQDLVSDNISGVVQDEVSRSINNVDAATNFKQIMNAVWDEDEDVASYRARLAQVVGDSDAERTPESVLALVQPTLQLAELDQGVGALMQEELAEVGGMGGGITELATKSAVADGMAAETGALVNAVGGLANGPGIMAVAPEATGVDPMVLQAMMQGTGPMGQGSA